MIAHCQNITIMNKCLNPSQASYFRQIKFYIKLNKK